MKVQMPALTFSRAGVVWPVRDDNPLTQASKHRIQRGDFDGMTIIDAERRLYAVTGVQRRGHAPPFWGLRLFTPRMYRIDLELRDEGFLPMGEIRDRVWRGIEKQASFWEAAWDLDELKSQLAARQSVEGIVELVLGTRPPER